MAIVIALTLFFRVDSVVVSGQQRYTEEEIRTASGVHPGDNMYLLNKHEVARNILRELPYISTIRINRRLPDTLLIEIQESGKPMAVVQDGSAWLVSSDGKIVEQKPEAEAVNYGLITGCELLAPSVGTSIALATEYAAQQESLINLLEALEDAGITDEVDGIRLDDLSYINMDYGGRFTVRIAYNADYSWELTKLTQTLAREEIQSNMTGTIDLRLDDENVYLMQNVR
jgi:cell division protein FtsQ